MSDPLLKVRDLSVGYRDGRTVREVVSRVSFDIGAGQVLGIIGESGAGKSSLALALLGLHDPGMTTISGEAIFQGKDLLSMDESSLCDIRGSGIGMIFQDPSGALDPAMKVEDQVAEAITLHLGISGSEARSMAREKLAEVGVSEEVITVAPYMHQLSGGLRQRAMIAATLACDPALLLADEPTSSLDVTLQSQIIDLLNSRRRKSGLSIIFISHDLALVASFADELLVLHQGMVVEHGASKDVLSNPQHPYTADLIRVSRFQRIQRKVPVANS